jgi:hypothetical protein
MWQAPLWHERRRIFGGLKMQDVRMVEYYRSKAQSLELMAQEWMSHPHTFDKGRQAHQLAQYWQEKAQRD